MIETKEFNFKQVVAIVVATIIITLCIRGCDRTDTVEIEDKTEVGFEGSIGEEGWYPGKTDEAETYQVMPEVVGKTSHDRFKELAERYNVSAGDIWEVENKYGIREGMVLCIMIAETSGGTRGYAQNGCYNVGNVGNNDRGDRVCYDSFKEGISAIGRVLNNKYLGGIQTLGCLSNAGSCIYLDDNGHRYASSDGNRERTITHCLNTIYGDELGDINPKTFNVRRNFIQYQ